MTSLPSQPGAVGEDGAVRSHHPFTMRAIAASNLTFQVRDWAPQRFSLRACLAEWAIEPARWTPVAGPARVVGL
jgi:hypothetical protein